MTNDLRTQPLIRKRVPTERPPTTLPLRVLVTAQPFGFGPAAAMAQVFDYLRPHVHHLAFAGAGHTCDIHTQLPYDAVYRLPAEGSDEAFRRLCVDHDASLISCDFPAAEAAKAGGIPFGFYDPIPWFWSQWPRVSEFADLYLCQNFYGVRERVREHTRDTARKNVVIVPPITPNLSQAAAKRDSLVLMNLGGICNPLHSLETSVTYARLITSLVPAAARMYSDVQVTTSQSIVNQIQHELPAARTIPPSGVQHLLGTSELAAMTPGLGNIYEAAALAKRILWLPPANDSQGQQLVMLQRRGLAPFAADWHDIMPTRAPIDYWGSEQTVLKNIADAIHDASNDPAATERLLSLFLHAHRAPATPNPLMSLLNEFGADGARHVAEIFVQRVLVPLAGARRTAR